MNWYEKNVIDLNGKFYKKKKNIILFSLFLIMLVSISLMFVGFSLAKNGPTYEVRSVWKSDSRDQVDPQYVFENNAFLLDKSIVVTETSIKDHGLSESLYKYDTDFKNQKQVELGSSRYSVYTMEHNGVLYYLSYLCSSGNCQPYLYRVNEEFDIPTSDKIMVTGELYYMVEENLNDDYNNFDDTSINIVSTDENGNILIYYTYYSGEDHAYKISKDFTTGEDIVLSQEDVKKYFPEIAKLTDREKVYKQTVEDTYIGEDGQPVTEKNEVNKYDFTSYLDLGNGNHLYLGKTNDKNAKPYMEVVDNTGKVLTSNLSDKYISYANPIIVDKYLVINASYDTDKTLGTKKSDLLVFDYSGKQLTSYSNNSYFINLIALDNHIVTERVYVEGVCSSDRYSYTISSGSKVYTKYATFNAWDVNSCKTNHYFEKYEILSVTSEFEEVIEEVKNNPETAVFPILMFVVVSVVMLLFIKVLLKKSNDLV